MADLSAYISFLVKFDVTNINAPVIVLTDNSVYPGGVPATLTGIFTITQPDGMTRTGSFTTPDISWNGSSLPPASIALRLATGNLIQQGEYTIKYEVAATGYSNTILTRTFTIGYVRPTISLQSNFDVFTPNLYYRDVTSYASGLFTQTIVRTWEAVINTIGTVTGIDSATFDLAYTGSYYDAAYAITFSATVLNQSTVYSFLSIADLLETVINADVYSPPSASLLLIYLTTLKTRLDALINNCVKYDTAKKNYEYAFILYQHSLLRFCSGDTDNLSTYIAEILNVYYNNVRTSPAHTNFPISAYSYSCAGGGSGNSAPYLIKVKGTQFADSTHYNNPAIIGKNLVILFNDINRALYDTEFDVTSTGINITIPSFNAVANPTYDMIIWIVNPSSTVSVNPSKAPYIGIVGRGNSSDPVSGTPVFSDPVIAGLGATNGGGIQITIDRFPLYNFGTNPDFTYNPADGVNGTITLLNSANFNAGSTVVIPLNQ